MRGGDFSTITEAILSEKPYPLKAALINKYNILSFPNPHALLKRWPSLILWPWWNTGLQRWPRWPMWSFPEPHFLEAGGMTPRAFTAYYPQIALREAVHDPLYDAKGFGSIITGIAKAMGLGEYFEGVSSGDLTMQGLEAL
jgi:thiosulfate reductase / polysulfide reductase chain A